MSYIHIFIHKHYVHTLQQVCTHFLPDFTHLPSLICFPAVCFHPILSRLRWSLRAHTEVYSQLLAFHCEMPPVFTCTCFSAGFQPQFQLHLNVLLWLSSVSVSLSPAPQSRLIRETQMSIRTCFILNQGR